MPILRRDDTVQTAQGWAVPGAQVYYLEQPANTDALTPLAQVYSDLSGTPAANPQITDGFGHAVAYLNNDQLYTIVWVSPVIGKIIYTDQNVGNAVSSITTTVVPAGSISGAIDGVNTVFTFSSPNPPAALIFWVNFPLIQGTGFNYIYASGTVTVTVTQAPQVGDTLNALIFS